jgi:hypothetical protein
LKQSRGLSPKTVKLNENCSVVLQRGLPPKLKDPGSFSIPCVINGVSFDRVLCDLGASINLMSMSVFNKLSIGNIKSTDIVLQFADRSIAHPIGIVEDVLVKVDKFVFPVDFMVLDMKEDQEPPLILGRPFLATARALIDVQTGQLTLRVNKEKVVLKIYKELGSPSDKQKCYRIDELDLEHKLEKEQQDVGTKEHKDVKDGGENKEKIYTKRRRKRLFKTVQGNWKERWKKYFERSEVKNQPKYDLLSNKVRREPELIPPRKVG